jgi:hypothetical protein
MIRLMMGLIDFHIGTYSSKPHRLEQAKTKRPTKQKIGDDD